MNGMILAAGLGTRFRPYTETLPKPVLPFLNIPFVHHSFFVSEKIGGKKLIVNTHYLPDEVQKICEGFENVQTSYEPQLLGNAGGVKNVESFLKDDNFFVLNADTVIIPQNPKLFEDVRDYHLKEQPLATFAGMLSPLAGTKYNALWADPKGNLLSISKEKPQEDATPYHFYGIRFFSPKIFEYMPDGESDLLKEVIPKAMEAGEKIKIFHGQAEFFDGCDINSFLKDTERALELISSSHHLKDILSSYTPNSSFKNGVLLGEGCKIPSSVKINGFAVIGDNVEIGEDCVLENVVLQKNVKISKGQNLKNDLILADR